MKKVMVGLFVLVFMLGVVSAGDCSANPDDIIMKLYSEENSHGALWNDGSYGVDICYSDYFVAYGGDMATVHECETSVIPTNKVVGLYSAGNAHAEKTGLDDYDFDVCYGDLSCVARDDSCDAGEVAVLSLYSDSNSHLAEGGDVVAYTKKVCCVAGGTGGGSVLEWRDMSGVKITMEKPNLGDTIQAVMVGAVAGAFNFWEFTLVNSNFLNFDGVDVDGDLVGEWTITQGDLDDAGGLDRFAFEVDSSGEYSYEIAINPDEDDDPMNVTIDSPECGADFNESQTVGIVISAEDEDDVITGTVTIGDDVYNFSNGGRTINYDFNNVSGNHQIMVEAINTRGKRAKDIVSVMVLEMTGTDYNDGTYVAACIDEPVNFFDFSGSVVYFNASSTKGIKIVGGMREDISPGDDRMDFYWNFFPDGRTYGEYYAGTGNSSAYEFTTEFAISGDNSAVLRVEVN